MFNDYCLLVLFPVNEYVKSMESKLESMMKEKCELDAEEMEKLGKRDHERYPFD